MADVAARQIEEQLAARGLGSPALVHAGLEQMQLGLAQGTLEPKQQTVVVGGRIVNAVGVGDQRVAQRADLQKLMPVATGAGQTGHLHPEHQADPPQTNLGHQPLKARPPLGGGAGAAEIVINDGHALARPPEVECPINQPVLEAGRLMMALDLLEGGLAGVDERPPDKGGGVGPAGQGGCAGPSRASELARTGASWSASCAAAAASRQRIASRPTSTVSLRRRSIGNARHVICSRDMAVLTISLDPADKS